MSVCMCLFVRAKWFIALIEHRTSFPNHNCEKFASDNFNLSRGNLNASGYPLFPDRFPPFGELDSVMTVNLAAPNLTGAFFMKGICLVTLLVFDPNNAGDCELSK